MSGTVISDFQNSVYSKGRKQYRVYPSKPEIQSILILAAKFGGKWIIEGLQPSVEDKIIAYVAKPKNGKNRFAKPLKFPKKFINCGFGLKKATCCKVGNITVDQYICNNDPTFRLFISRKIHKSTEKKNQTRERNKLEELSSQDEMSQDDGATLPNLETSFPSNQPTNSLPSSPLNEPTIEYSNPFKFLLEPSLVSSSIFGDNELPNWENNSFSIGNEASDGSGIENPLFLH